MPVLKYWSREYDQSRSTSVFRGLARTGYTLSRFRSPVIVSFGAMVISLGRSAEIMLPAGTDCRSTRPSVVRPITPRDHHPAHGSDSLFICSGFEETFVRLQCSLTSSATVTASTDRWSGLESVGNAPEIFLARLLRAGLASAGVRVADHGADCSECRAQPTISAKTMSGTRQRRVSEVMRISRSNSEVEGPPRSARDGSRTPPTNIREFPFPDST